jgi:hypothetical protein
MNQNLHASGVGIVVSDGPPPPTPPCIGGGVEH